MAANQEPIIMPPRKWGFADWLITFTCIGILVCVFAVTRQQLGTMIAPLFGYAVELQQSAPAPTSTNVQRFNDQVAAPATSVEDKVIPTVVAAPVSAPIPVAQPTAPPRQSYSPIDLGSAPVPTAQTILSQEQYDASQASEEQNQLNTAQSGLTEAQRLVEQHDAEWAARQAVNP